MYICIYIYSPLASLVLLLEPLISFLAFPTRSRATYRSRLMGAASARTELHTKEMKKQKKRETDRRYRQKKKKAVQETENKLAMAITENENLKLAVEELRQEIFHLTSQRQLIEQRFDTIYTEMRKEIGKAVQETENKLAMAITENENLKRSVEELRQEIFDLTSQLQLIEQRFETTYNELEKEIECVRAEAEGFGEQRGMALGTGNSQQPFHVVTRFSN
uniref:BZIP domain-containing protein n=1 Tax=Salix viminalis TaxID=40686 RepID=A0A6N2LTN0_SALVM